MNYIDGRLILNENVIELIKREFEKQEKQIEERYAEFKVEQDYFLFNQQ